MTTTSIKLAAAAAIAFGGAGVLAAPASAAPMLDPGIAHSSDLTGAKPEAVRWVCGPYRCWWRPGPYYGGYGFYGRPRPWGYGYGWRRPGWGGGWHGGGWHGGWRRW